MGKIQEDTKDLRMHMSDLREDTKDIGIDMARQIAEARNKLEQTVTDQINRAQSSMLGNIVQQIKDMVSLSNKLPLQHRILRQLIYEDMDARRIQIHDAAPDTCRWILEDDLDDLAEECQSSRGSSSRESDEFSEESELNTDSSSTYFGSESSGDIIDLESQSRIRQAFINWLRTGSGVMHISGKAGSGKSTLMKFIGQHGTTTEILEVWAAPKRLILGQFYLWNAGTPAQRTLTGVYRSLLFQALIQCPNLIEDVFPYQVNSMKHSVSMSDQFVEKLEKFGDLHIEEAFELLLQKAPAQGHRLCFIIDGLDEFEGNRLRHEALATKLNQWTTSGEVKLLVSSRPWPEFHDVFTSNDTIHFHELNRLDIKTFCLNQLNSDKAANLLESEHRDALRFVVIAKILDSSKGIFLWAYLVLDNILMGLRNGDSVNDLKRKVDEFPPELDDLYDKLREPIEKSEIDKRRSNQILLLVLKAPQGFRILPWEISWLAGDDEPGLLNIEFPTETEVRPYSIEEMNQRLGQVQKRINGLVRGLLEISRITPSPPLKTHEHRNVWLMSQEVTFCHRTTRDYLIRNERRHAALQESWPAFSTSDVYGRICLARIIYNPQLRKINMYGRNFMMVFFGYPVHSNWQHFTTETLNRIGDVAKNIWPPGIVGLSRVGIDNSCGFEAPEPSLKDSCASFIHFASYFGLGKYVLTTVGTDLAQDTRGKSGFDGSILTSAWCGYTDYNFGDATMVEFIETFSSHGEMVTCHPFYMESGKSSISIPSWMIILSGLTAHYTFLMCDRIWGKVNLWYHPRLDHSQIMKSFRILQEHGATAEEEVIMTLQIRSRPTTSYLPGPLPTVTISTNISVQSKQILQWAQDFATVAGELGGGKAFKSEKKEELRSLINFIAEIKRHGVKHKYCKVQSLRWKSKDSDDFEEIEDADSWWYRVW